MKYWRKKMRFKELLPFLFLLVLPACSGYRLKRNENPLTIYGINRVYVPMFVNHSIIPNISGPMTREITCMLSEYSELHVSSLSGKGKDDAVLLGIISSGQFKNEVFNVTGKMFTSESTVGDRKQFYVPTKNSYSVSLRLVLIKNPSNADLKLMEKFELVKYMNAHPKVVFNEVLNLNSSFSRTVVEGNDVPKIDVDGGEILNFTKTKAIFEDSVRALAKRAAKDFQEVVLDAF